LEDRLVPNGITDEVALAIACEEVRLIEDAELLGDITLLHTGGFDELGDRYRPPHESLQQPQPGRF
jgi:hypothetical protein